MAGLTQGGTNMKELIEYLTNLTKDRDHISAEDLAYDFTQSWPLIAQYIQDLEQHNVGFNEERSDRSPL